MNTRIRQTERRQCNSLENFPNLNLNETQKSRAKSQPRPSIKMGVLFSFSALFFPPLFFVCAPHYQRVTVALRRKRMHEKKGKRKVKRNERGRAKPTARLIKSARGQQQQQTNRAGSDNNNNDDGNGNLSHCAARVRVNVSFSHFEFVAYFRAPCEKIKISKRRKKVRDCLNASLACVCVCARLLFTQQQQQTNKQTSTKAAASSPTAYA